MQGYREFCVLEPKVRLVHSLPYRDRIVQHVLCDEILTPYFDKRLIHDAAACRKGKGTHYGLERLKTFMKRHFGQYGTDGWILKGDISSYFASVDHGVLKDILLLHIEDIRLRTLLEDIIDSMPDGKGLPLGNMTSQLFANLYLNPLDRLVKERMQMRRYVRYMDDVVLLHHDRGFLKECLREIREFAETELKLQLNAKTQIFPIRNGVDFLGFHTYLTERGKVIRKVRHASARRMKRKMKVYAEGYRTGSITPEATRQSLYSWLGHAEFGDTYSLRKKMLEGFVMTKGSVSNGKK